MNLHLALGKAVTTHPKHPSNPQPVSMEAEALWRAACPHGMRPGLTVPFSSLPISWLNVSRPAGKHTAPFSAQTLPKEQSSINKRSLRKERGTMRHPHRPEERERECPVGNAAHLGELPRWFLLRAAWSPWRQTAYLKHSIRGVPHGHNSPRQGSDTELHPRIPEDRILALPCCFKPLPTALSAPLGMSFLPCPNVSREGNWCPSQIQG